MHAFFQTPYKLTVLTQYNLLTDIAWSKTHTHLNPQLPLQLFHFSKKTCVRVNWTVLASLSYYSMCLGDAITGIIFITPKLDMQRNNYSIRYDGMPPCSIFSLVCGRLESFERSERYVEFDNNKQVFFSVFSFMRIICYNYSQHLIIPITYVNKPFCYHILGVPKLA